MKRERTQPFIKRLASERNHSVRRIRSEFVTMALFDGTFGIDQECLLLDGVSPDTKGYGLPSSYHAWRVKAKEAIMAKKLSEGSEEDRLEQEGNDTNYQPVDGNDRLLARPTASAFDTPIVLSLLVVLCGCACQAPYEVLNTSDRGCADLIALSEYVYGLLASAPQALAASSWHVPWHFHVGLAAASLSYTYLVSAALATAMPMPIAITIKNGNLVANMARVLLDASTCCPRRYCRLSLYCPLRPDWQWSGPSGGRVRHNLGHRSHNWGLVVSRSRRGTPGIGWSPLRGHACGGSAILPQRSRTTVLCLPLAQRVGPRPSLAGLSKNCWYRLAWNVGAAPGEYIFRLLVQGQHDSIGRRNFSTYGNRGAHIPAFCRLPHLDAAFEPRVSRWHGSMAWKRSNPYGHISVFRFDGFSSRSRAAAPEVIR